jgi:hypothetical protein
LKHIAVDGGARLIEGIALQSRGRLAELEIQPCTPAFAPREIDSTFQHHGSLVEGEGVARDVVGAQQIHAADGGVEIVGVVTID